MALVAIDAVVDITRDAGVRKIGRVVAAMAPGALEDGVVIRVDVAGRADVIRVAVTGWKWGVLRVIKRGIRPSAGVMALLAGSREELRLRGVPRVSAGVVIRLMTADAGGRQSRVVVVYVAICTFSRWHHVRTGQRECGVVVVERRIRPGHSVMTDRAGRGKPGRC